MQYKQVEVDTDRLTHTHAHTMDIHILVALTEVTEHVPLYYTVRVG